tara:strand:+ start:1245 stop:3092 length:1848 start_codon:yes stop_codon:yes gene_type:complete
MIIDIEADGLLDDVTKIHCLSFSSDGTEVFTLYKYDLIIDFLRRQKVLIGHNIIRYDIPVIEKILGLKIKAKLYDTLPMSWVMNTDRPKHGLESFGVDFGVPKPPITDWVNLSPEEYKHRCEEDVKINCKLWHNLIQRFMLVYKDNKHLDKFLSYLTFKMQCAYMAEKSGWKLDKELAEDCITKLRKEQDSKVEDLKQVMPMRSIFKKKTAPKAMYKKDGTLSKQGIDWVAVCHEQGLPSYYVGEVEVLSKVEPPNPNSSDQVKDWLTSLGWKPCTYKYVRDKEKGSDRKIPQVRKNGELTSSVKLLIEREPSVEVLDGLTVIQHRLGIFEGFISCERDGVVHAGIDGLTNTLRFKHKKPLVNLPGVDKAWGTEVRSCLIAEEGYVLCGADMTSLEDTTKRHYMKPYDPEYVAEMSQDGFDPHLDLAKHAGAVTQEDINKHNSGVASLKALRKNFKVVNYSATYGIGAAKLSRETGMSEGEAKLLLDAYWERNWAVAQFSDDNLRKVKRINGQMWVQNPVSTYWHTLRYEKDVFSTLNQSTGAYCFDRWVAGYLNARPNIVGQFHDESINSIKKGEEEEHKAVLVAAIGKLNDDLKLNVELGIDVQFGNKYSEIH